MLNNKGCQNFNFQSFLVLWYWKPFGGFHFVTVLVAFSGKKKENTCRRHCLHMEDTTYTIVWTFGKRALKEMCWFQWTLMSQRISTFFSCSYSHTVLKTEWIKARVWRKQWVSSSSDESWLISLCTSVFVSWNIEEVHPFISTSKALLTKSEVVIKQNLHKQAIKDWVLDHSVIT